MNWYGWSSVRWRNAVSRTGMVGPRCAGEMLYLEHVIFIAGVRPGGAISSILFSNAIEVVTA